MTLGIVNVAELNPHEPAPYTFTEAALCLRDSIRAAGYSSEIYFNRTDKMQRTIVFGAVPPYLRGMDQLEPAKAVVYNFEQLASTSSLLTADYRQWLGRWLVADYHSSNIDWLQKHHEGTRALELPIVPSPSIAFRPDLAYEPVNDVLFFGTPTPRREAVLQQLRDAGMTVEVVAGAFAHELAPAVKRARLVLHIHFYETGLFPLARILQPVAQGVPIVCEHSIHSALNDWSASGIVFAAYDDLVEACRALIADSKERERRAAENLAFAARIDFATPFRWLLQAWDQMPGQAMAAAPAPRIPAPPAQISAPVSAPAPLPSLNAAPSITVARRPIEPLLSNEEIEAILEAESHEMPPESHLPAAPIKMVERQPGKGKFGVWVVWLLIVFSIYTIYVSMR